ncbi:MAG: YraN family protein [Rhodothermia bacterium]|nr:MAG: YraN family protein [Rhodothermia bacterium]
MRKKVGQEGEALAAAYLEQKGYRILERNYRFQRAEVDLICFQPASKYEDGGELVFVEVKTRTSHAYGVPETAVDTSKQKNLKRAARSYLHEHRMEGALCRFDVLAITRIGGKVGGQVDIHHIEGAFQT